MARDDFSKPTQRVLAERVNHLCSNPDCRRLTAGPHSEPAKSLKTGRACHICAASPLGPRFDVSQSPAQRKSVENGIWLCATCSDRVDKDFAPLPKEELLRWKEEAERFARQGGACPPLPNLSIQTMSGLTFRPELDEQISGEDQLRFRDQQLVLVNNHIHAIRAFQAYMQLPERVANGFFAQPPPAGVDVEMEPEVQAFEVFGTGSVTRVGPVPLSSRWNLRINNLLPGNRIEITLRTTNLPPDQMEEFLAVINMDQREGVLDYYLEGSYQCEWHGSILRRDFLVPLIYDCPERRLTSTPSEDPGLHTIVRRF